MLKRDLNRWSLRALALQFQLMILDANPVVSEKEPYKGISKQHKNDRLIEGHKEKWW